MWVYGGKPKDETRAEQLSRFEQLSQIYLWQAIDPAIGAR
jgi:hypothetical protein